MRSLIAKAGAWGLNILRRRGRLPDFLGIGAQKSGTTWLYENLRQHPDLFLPDEKEVHYFDLHYERDLAKYTREFRRAGRRLAGEITPAYSILPPDRIRQVHTLMPDARLILLLRDPIERAWSHALMQLVQFPKCRFEDVSSEAFLEHFRSPESRQRGDYLATLDNWLTCYRREQLFVGFYDDLSVRPQALLRDVFFHLGVTEQVDWSAFACERVIHRGLGVPMPQGMRDVLIELYTDDLDRLAAEFGGAARAWPTRYRTDPSPA